MTVTTVNDTAMYAARSNENREAAGVAVIRDITTVLTAGTDRSGTANTSSATLAAVNSSRRGLTIQNIGANNIGVNEFGGTAAIGTAGTYTLVPGAFMTVRTSGIVTAIAATGATAYTATEY